MREEHIIVNGGSSQVQAHVGISRRDRDLRRAYSLRISDVGFRAYTAGGQFHERFRKNRREARRGTTEIPTGPRLPAIKKFLPK
jgi:hypothetical protein